MDTKSLTIVIPAYNEEPTLASVVSKVTRLAKKYTSNYEIIIVNDASTDKTGKIVNELASRDPKIIPVHNSQNMNFGYNFQKGLSLSRMDYISFIPGDDDISEESLEGLIRPIGAVDFILLYHSNYEARHPLRRVVSKLFVAIVNFLFNLKVKYYNGPAMFKTELLRSLSITTTSFAFVAEIVVTLIKRGYSYLEEPMVLRPERKGINLRVFRPRNTWGVVRTISKLWWRIQFKNNFNHGFF